MFASVDTLGRIWPPCWPMSAMYSWSGVALLQAIKEILIGRCSVRSLVCCTRHGCGFVLFEEIIVSGMILVVYLGEVLDPPLVKPFPNGEYQVTLPWRTMKVFEVVQSWEDVPEVLFL